MAASSDPGPIWLAVIFPNSRLSRFLTNGCLAHIARRVQAELAHRGPDRLNHRLDEVLEPQFVRPCSRNGARTRTIHPAEQQPLPDDSVCAQHAPRLADGCDATEPSVLRHVQHDGLKQLCAQHVEGACATALRATCDLSAADVPLTVQFWERVQELIATERATSDRLDYELFE
eukprot:scaffold10114_cov67-Phaeocystis_antarctica.AAC.7